MKDILLKNEDDKLYFKEIVEKEVTDVINNKIDDILEYDEFENKITKYSCTAIYALFVIIMVLCASLREWLINNIFGIIILVLSIVLFIISIIIFLIYKRKDILENQKLEEESNKKINDYLCSEFGILNDYKTIDLLSIEEDSYFATTTMMYRLDNYLYFFDILDGLCRINFNNIKKINKIEKNIEIIEDNQKIEDDVNYYLEVIVELEYESAYLLIPSYNDDVFNELIKG